MRCTAYTKFNNLCLAFAAKHGLRDWRFNWREATNCRKLLIFQIKLNIKIYKLCKKIRNKAVKCGDNEIFAVRKACPRTCLDPEGIKYCGHLEPREGCYCRDGFVRNSAGLCIRPQECGCRKPDGSGLVSVGQTIVSRDCSKRYTCAGAQQPVKVENLRRCSKNAVCIGNKENVPTCTCRQGFEGDGYRCKLKEGLVTTTKSANPCGVRGACGRGTTCRNNNGRAVCYCRNQVVSNTQTCCNREFRTL